MQNRPQTPIFFCVNALSSSPAKRSLKSEESANPRSLNHSVEYKKQKEFNAAL